MTEQEVIAQLRKWFDEGKSIEADPVEHCDLMKQADTLQGFMQLLGWHSSHQKSQYEEACGNYSRIMELV